MLFLFRLFSLIATPLFFAAVWYVAPVLLDTGKLLSLSGVLGSAWALQLAFLQRLTIATMADGLTAKEQERLENRLDTLRMRVWESGGIFLSCFFSMWMLTAFDLQKQSPAYAAAAGFLIGVGLSYLIQTANVYQESSRFLDAVKRRDNIAKKRSEAVKSMTSNNGK